ncbi:MAG: hypothetical protein ACI4GC_09085 [Acutalibacteraceae bacterium]
MTPKIHIAYGFHVNCYHSYRGDSNDNLGFGSDIRIIEHILDTLTALNKEGIPVKGTWDSENFFSLEKILPEFAPQIIEKMKDRVKNYGDENIIMGYSNGALGAMNKAELVSSIELAVSNEAGSGLKDLFGECAMLVRPQEVMFTPSQVSVYNKMGIEALCLYYSCVPFDAFRTIVPKLPDEWAFNPLIYTYKGESMTILPTYSNSDVCDAGCLRSWVKSLRKKQESGEIKTDLLIFINMDADAIFWESMNLPVIGSRLANTDGIHGLVKEVADLPYVVFDTPGNYVKTHKPIGTVDFTQDTADGNFTGYASWSEKPYNRKIWTAIDRARAMSLANGSDDKKSASFFERILLLSTTHFGLATPVLNIEREKKADALALSIVESEAKALKKVNSLTIYNNTESDVTAVQLKVNGKIKNASQLKVSGSGLEDYTVIPMDEDLNSVYLMCKFKQVKASYTVKVEVVGEKEKEKLDFLSVQAGDFKLCFTSCGKVYSAQIGGKKIGYRDFLKSFITYDKKDYAFSQGEVEPLSLGGSGKGLRLKGEIHLPEEITSGSYTYDFLSVPFSKGIIVRTEVNYPYTAETTSISTENSALGRYSDMKWKQAVPFQISPEFDGDISVVKRNFMGDISSFRTQSFPECDENNKRLDSFNHQLTAGLVGLTDGNYSLLVANARQVLGSMAHCPMRLNEDKSVRMNPFGTYYGNQRHHHGQSGGKILATYTLITPQGKSIAPAYNGVSETSLLSLYGFKGDKIEGELLSDIISFCDGAVAASPENSILSPFYDDNVSVKKPLADSVNENKLKSPILTGISGNLGKYIVRGAKAIGYIIVKQIKAR